MDSQASDQSMPSPNPNHPRLHQLFLRLTDGRTLSLDLPHANIAISSLKHLVFRSTNIPPSSQLLTLCGRVLPDGDNAPIPPNSTVSLSIRLCGGKGGFGSLLRGAATKAGQKKTSNFDACRDMSGRRLRHVNAERKLEEWRAEEEERRLEKIAEEFLRQNAKKAGGGKKAVGDGAEKYVDKYREDSAKCVERVEECVREIVGKRKIAKVTCRVESGGDAKKLKIWMGKRKLEDSDSDSGEDDCSNDDEENEQSVVSDGLAQHNLTGEAEGSSDSVTGGRHDQDGSGLGFCGSSSEEEREAMLPVSLYSGGCTDQQGMPILREENVCSKSVNLEVANVAEALPGIVLEVEASEPEEKSLDKCESADFTVVIQPHSDSSCTKQMTEAAPALEEADGLAEMQLGTLEEKPLNFDEYNSASEMEVLGMERLKTELQSRGLKCGGTLQERAARLFLLKSLPLDKIPKKHLAKK